MFYRVSNGGTKFAYYTIGGYYSAYGSYHDRSQNIMTDVFNPVNTQPTIDLVLFRVKHQLNPSNNCMTLTVLKNCHITMKVAPAQSFSLDADYHTGDILQFTGYYSQAWPGYAVQNLNLLAYPI